MVAAFLTILLFVVAWHHPLSRCKIKQKWHERVYWESNTKILLPSPEKALENVEPAEAVPQPNEHHICFPHATGDEPPRKGQVTGKTTFGKALTDLASKPEVKRVLEIGTWYGGGSTQSFVDGLKSKSKCTTNITHHCCEAFLTTFEVYKPAWEYARLYHQNNPVWLILGTSVGKEDMLQPADIPQNERGEHYRLYYERDSKIMQSQTPQLAAFCDRLRPNVVLIDGNEYTGWGEFNVVLQRCKPKWLALHDTGTLKTRKVEVYIDEHPGMFMLDSKGTDAASWSIYRVKYKLSPDKKMLLGKPRRPLFSQAVLTSVLKQRGTTRQKMHQRDIERKAMFSKVYDEAVWKHGNALIPKSGSGSTLTKTEAARNAIKTVVLKHNIKSIVDAPCGDLTWMKTLFPFFREHGVSYTGVDIVDSEVRKHKHLFPEHTFLNLDMALQTIPKADLIFSRQALQHMNAEDNIRTLNNWANSGSTFVLQTTYDTSQHGNLNRVGDGTNSLINFQAEPYNFPNPIERYEEQRQSSFTEYLALWQWDVFLPPEMETSAQEKGSGS